MLSCSTWMICFDSNCISGTLSMIESDFPFSPLRFGKLDRIVISCISFSNEILRYCSLGRAASDRQTYSTSAKLFLDMSRWVRFSKWQIEIGRSLRLLFDKLSFLDLFVLDTGVCISAAFQAELRSDAYSDLKDQSVRH